jgi:hypothetical protein
MRSALSDDVSMSHVAPRHERRSGEDVAFTLSICSVRASRWLSALASLLLALLPAPASAWWEYGHETTAEIALGLVKPRTRVAIVTLMRRQRVLDTPSCPAGTIEEVSIWADCIKTLGDRFSYVTPWHYQDADICKDFDVSADCGQGACVSVQIARAQRMLADSKLGPHDRLTALALLVHFVGDLNQPLHAATHDSDAGGNGTKGSYGAIARTNLHSIWDGLLADRAISTPPAGPAAILAEVPPAERARVAAGTIDDWAHESWRLAKEQVYGSVLPDPCAVSAKVPVVLDQATIVKLIPVVRLQIARGGLRLARLLDEALDGDHPEVAHPPRRASSS